MRDYLYILKSKVQRLREKVFHVKGWNEYRAKCLECDVPLDVPLDVVEPIYRRVADYCGPCWETRVFADTLSAGIDE